MTTRRTFVAGAASLAVPAAPASATTEPNHERVRRLCSELADALGEYVDGQFGAEILPRSIEPAFPVMLFDLASRDEAMQRYRAIMMHAETLREARQEADRLSDAAHASWAPSSSARKVEAWFAVIHAERQYNAAVEAMVSAVMIGSGG